MNPIARLHARKYKSGAPLGAGGDFCVSPSLNTLFLNGKSYGYKGPGLIPTVSGGRLMFNTPDGSYASLGDAATAGVGAIAGTIARALLIAGSGPVYYGGASLGFNASTLMQLLLWYNGAYTNAGSGPFVVGTNPVAAPTLSASAVASTIMTGAVYSIRIYPIRSATGGRGRASSPSNVLTVTGTKVIAGNFPAIPTGYDRWGIDASGPGYGVSGPHLKLPTNLSGEIAESALGVVEGVPRAVLLEWAGGDLVGRPLAPIDDYPPPLCVWVMGLNDAAAAIAAYGDPVLGTTISAPGTAISVSERVYIESFPADWLLFMPQAPVGVLQPSDNLGFIGCPDYMLALTYTGAKPPMSLQTVWKGTGVAHQGAMCLGEGGRLYAFTSQLGMVRVGEKGQPDDSFALDMAEDFSGLTAANVHLGYDGSYKRVLVGSGQTLYPFDVTSADEWDTPLSLAGKITGNLCAMVTVGNKVRLAANDGAAIRLYEFNTGTGTVSELYYPWQVVSDPSANIQRLEQRVRFDSTADPLLVKMYRNRRALPAMQRSVRAPGTGLQDIDPIKFDAGDVQLYQLYQRLVGHGGDVGFEDAVLRGEGCEI